MESADLSRADLSQAHLSSFGEKCVYYPPPPPLDQTPNPFYDTYWGGTDLKDADLSYAILRSAEVDDGLLAEAKSLKGAIMPDGSKHP